MVITESPGSLKLQELHKLLCDELGDLLHSENMLLKALPRLSAGSASPALKELFEGHIEQTREHVERLERMFEILELPSREKKCEGMMGLLVECQHLLTRSRPSLANDQGLISASRKFKAFEELAYGSVAVWAETCGLGEIQELAEQSASEENAMNSALEMMLPKSPGGRGMTKTKRAVALAS